MGVEPPCGMPEFGCTGLALHLDAHARALSANLV